MRNLNDTTRARLALAATPVTAYVVVMVLISALWVKPPLSGWIFLAAVALVGAGLIAAAFVLFPKSRTNVTPVSDRERVEGVLALVDSSCERAEVSEALVRRLHGRDVRRHVIVPILLDPATFLTGDEDAAHAEVERRLEETLVDLRSEGVSATGSVGTDDAVQAVGDALAVFPASELVIVTATGSQWLHEEVDERTRALVPSVDVIELERPSHAGAWGPLDETTLSPSERRFVHDGVEGHHADAVIQATFGGGDPNRLLDFPPSK